MACRGRPPALDRREVPADTVHLADGCPRREQGAVDRLLVFQRKPFDGSHQQRGAAAGDEAQHEIIGAQALHQLLDAAGSVDAGRVGHGVRGLDDLDAPAGHAIAVAGNYQAGQLAEPVILHRLGHRRRRLAGANHDHAATRRRR